MESTIMNSVIVMIYYYSKSVKLEINWDPNVINFKSRFLQDKNLLTFGKAWNGKLMKTLEYPKILMGRSFTVTKSYC